MNVVTKTIVKLLSNITVVFARQNTSFDHSKIATLFIPDQQISATLLCLCLREFESRFKYLLE